LRFRQAASGRFHGLSARLMRLTPQADYAIAQAVQDTRFGLWWAIEPLQKFGAFGGTFEAFIQFLAQQARQAGDFTITGVHNFDLVRGCCDISVFRHGLI
jgi:hypothetical protein